jgi:hypothetical protein
MKCPECGFKIDPHNESQDVCPACGTDPNMSASADDDFDLAAALDDGEAFAESRVTVTEMLGLDAPMEPEIDYVPDPELELAITDGEALMQSLTEPPILVAGNRLIN